MTRIETDRRHIEAELDPDGERAAAAIAAEYLDVRLRLARALLRIERGRTFALSGCASIVQYGVRLGLPASEARALVDLGRALEAQLPAATAAADGPGDRGEVIAQDTVEDRIRAGRLAVENAAVAGRLLAEPGLVRPGEDWIAKAESLRASELRREVQRRVESAAQGTPELLPITVHVTERVRDDFHRARSLVSREAQLMLTEGQAFARIVRFYLDAEDPLRSRRGGDACGADAAGGPPRGPRRRSRYVQAAARGAVLARSGDRCEVPGCPHDTFLEFAHVEAHALGGSADARNLLRLCHAHHTQFDAGCLAFSGWSDDGGGRGERPRFRDATGGDVAAGPRTTSPRRVAAERGFPGTARPLGDRTSPRLPPEPREPREPEPDADGGLADSDRDAFADLSPPSSRGAWPGDSEGPAWGVGEPPAPAWRVHRRNGESVRCATRNAAYRGPDGAPGPADRPDRRLPMPTASGFAPRPPP